MVNDDQHIASFISLQVLKERFLSFAVTALDNYGVISEYILSPPTTGVAEFSTIHRGSRYPIWQSPSFMTNVLQEVTSAKPALIALQAAAQPKAGRPLGSMG